MVDEGAMAIVWFAVSPALFLTWVYWFCVLPSPLLFPVGVEYHMLPVFYWSNPNSKMKLSGLPVSSYIYLYDRAKKLTEYGTCGRTKQNQITETRSSTHIFTSVK